jgi:3'(2'), 5'-bisphosphate nucleotidase
VGVPARDQVFVGDVSRGLARRSDGSAHRPARAAVRGRNPTIVASRRHGGEKLQGALRRIEQEQGGYELLNVGSALKLCLLAEGKADVYPRLAPTSEWDTAAAQAVLEASGGGVFALDGTPLVCNKDVIVNPSFVAVADRSVDWLKYFQAP